MLAPLKILIQHPSSCGVNSNHFQDFIFLFDVSPFPPLFPKFIFLQFHQRFRYAFTLKLYIRPESLLAKV
jgi:hypothetical protein